MLATNERTLLLESLRPPDGYDLDFAIATTFTLDLVSLLTAPIGFTYFELEGDPDTDKGALDPLVLLQTVRRYSGRIAVFCQAGHIKVPKIQQPLFASLEKTVIQVQSYHENGIFHPKVWVLRFIAPDMPVLYRVITQSRNLTFDKCWDTSVVLDGTLIDRQNAYAANHPLADFVESLPGLADKVSKAVKSNIAIASRELRKVLFTVPEPFDDYSFHPFGIENYAGSVDEGRGKALIISPFLTAGIAGELSQLGTHTTLVSRLDQLESVSAEDLSGFDEIFTVDPALEASVEFDISDFPSAPSSGLHAKVYVVESGHRARVWTGSANATAAAFNQNVEFMVSLGGSKNQCGVQNVLGAEADQGAFRKLLLPYTPRKDPVVCDQAEQNLEKLLDQARRIIASANWSAAVSAEGGSFMMALAASDLAAAPENVRCRVWPITLTEISAKLFSLDISSVAFGPLTFEALTPFFAFELEGSVEGKSQAIKFVVRAQLVGAPEDRDERLLNYYLRDPDQVLRFLLLLLAPNDPDSAGLADAGEGMFGTAWATSNQSGDSLLEAMLRAICNNHTALDSVASAVADLRKTPEGAALVPPGFDGVWGAIWAARQQLTKNAS